MPGPAAIPKPSPVATTEPRAHPHASGIATPISWCRVGAFPNSTAFYDWRDDLWWPDTDGGLVLWAFIYLEPRLLTRC